MNRIYKPMALIAALCAPSMGLAESHQFKLSISGITAGTLKLDASETGTSYSAKGGLFSAGLVKAFANIGFDGRVSGHHKNGTYAPKSYVGTARSGKDTSKVRMSYAGGTPKVLEYTSKRNAPKNPPTAAQKKGAVDVMTATHVLFQDRPLDDLCQQTIPIFDGRKTSKITMRKAASKGNQVQCTGTYARIAGFSKGQLDKGRNFPFTMNYEKQGNGLYRLMEFSTKTTFGRARATRK